MVRALPRTNELDPFDDFVRPPVDETPSERANRKMREAKEKLVSDAIDEQIKQDKQALQKTKGLVKILLLGQSESGKSTTLKNFRLTYAREEWEAEKTSWKAVIQLNLVRSIGSTLNTLQSELDGEPLPSSIDFDEIDPLADSTKGSLDLSSAEDDLADSSLAHVQLSADDVQNLQALRLRLAALRRAETVLKLKLGAGTEEVTNMDEYQEIPNSQDSNKRPAEAPDSRYLVRARRRKRIQGAEMVVRGWRELLSSARRDNGFLGRGANVKMQDSTETEVGEILVGCREDMNTVWTNQTFRSVLRKRGVDMENNAGFFLDDIDRIASKSYIPSDDDIVRSRLRTVGVQEYRIHVDVPKTLHAKPQREWIIYDVGGSRTMASIIRTTFLYISKIHVSLSLSLSFPLSLQRRAWIPFFDNVNAIIFLAPVSGFDEVLLEDASINRLNDSVGLWKAIISSQLLQNVTMVCFLNKCDILQRKLKNGIQFSRYVGEYGDRPNDVAPVVKFIKNKFTTMAAKHSIDERPVYIYTTSVTDTKATAATLRSVRDGIFRANLVNAQIV
ncbi:hypothetical protein D9757_008589 [Collybiopsis confluens]|uniref:G-alpha-domain-containing protein n=1 Tax=Collybiopsis confluens TaxID=2823264 RepID=A0A8H5HMQ3_9AGAR|nr:hypothetical protein D9757_008589 [Collybiopsis confluens]